LIAAASAASAASTNREAAAGPFRIVTLRFIATSIVSLI
jgi:hypothetical protein